MEGPGVGAVPAQVQTDAVLSQQVASPDDQAADPGASKLHPQVVVRDVLGGDLQVRVRESGGRALVCPDKHLGCLPRLDAEREDHPLDEGCRVGLDRLKLYGPPFEVAQPTVAPGVEGQERLRLDEPFPGSLVGVEDHDLLLVHRRQRAARPTPGGLDGDLLARDPGPALHGPHRRPGRWNRGAGEDVVERREQQVVPRAVDPLAEYPLLLLVIDEALENAFALVEQVFAALLLLLDIVHHAVAARKGVLKLLRHEREPVPARLRWRRRRPGAC